MGGALADLANYIQAHGGQIIGSAVLVNAARSGKVIPSAKTLRLTSSEIEQLQRNKRALSDYVRKALTSTK
jgi:hypothetical protein